MIEDMEIANRFVNFIPNSLNYSSDLLLWISTVIHVSLCLSSNLQFRSAVLIFH